MKSRSPLLNPVLLAAASCVTPLGFVVCNLCLKSSSRHIPLFPLIAPMSGGGSTIGCVWGQLEDTALVWLSLEGQPTLSPTGDLEKVLSSPTDFFKATFISAGVPGCVGVEQAGGGRMTLTLPNIPGLRSTAPPFPVAKQRVGIRGLWTWTLCASGLRCVSFQRPLLIITHKVARFTVKRILRSKAGNGNVLAAFFFFYNWTWVRNVDHWEKLKQ